MDVEGIVTKIWDRSGHVFAHLAIYNENAEIMEPPKKKGDLPRRQAHYVTLQFTDGKTYNGVPVSLSAKDHVRVAGYLRDASCSESLSTFLRKAKQFERIQDRDDERRAGRGAAYGAAKTLIRFM